MENRLLIRPETERDYERVEQITREAFYNVYRPGCTEHYLVHIMRTHADFVPELAFVLELDGELIGNVMYTKASLLDGAGGEKPILTFGPVSIAPAFQRRGYGKRLLEASFERAAALGYEAIVIFGDPNNYVGCGFVSCKRHNVCSEPGVFPASMLVKELRPGALDGRLWAYLASSVMELDEAAAQRFDDALPPMEKRVLPSQETFYILSHALLT